MEDKQNYPGTFVPINNFGLDRFADLAKLSELERRYTTVAVAKAKLDPVQGNFDRSHLQAIHKAIFGEVYPWAGQERTYPMQKGRSAVGSKEQSVFDDHTSFDRGYDKLSKAVGDPASWQGMNKTDFASTLTNTYAVMNKMHPFREGNGRTMRYFLEAMADKAGYDLNLDRVPQKEWNQAAIQSFDGDTVGLNKIFASSLTPIRQIAFDNFKQDAALKIAPELAGAYAAMEVLSATLRKGGVPPFQYDKLMATGKGLVSARLAQGATITQAALQKGPLQTLTEAYTAPAQSQSNQKLSPKPPVPAQKTPRMTR